MPDGLNTGFASDGTDTVMRLEGPLTAATAHSFREAIDADRSPLLILDMAQVPYVDSSGIGALVKAQVTRGNSRRKLILARVSERVQTVLRITHIERIFAIAETIEEAQAMGHAASA